MKTNLSAQNTSSNKCLEAKQLSMHFGNKTALRDLSFTVKPGEIFCLLGQNGAGKTTTINVLLGLLKPSSGDVLIDTVSIINCTTPSNVLAYIPEVVQLYGNLSGLENLDFFSQLAGFRYAKKELQHFLLQANLQEDAHSHRLSTYSKGMRQKVGIAIALAKNSSYILMDEPTSGLDPKASVQFAHICKKLSSEGVGILMATHDIFNAVNIGSRIGIMKEGSLIHTANSANITAQELQELYLKTI